MIHSSISYTAILLHYGIFISIVHYIILWYIISYYIICCYGRREGGKDANTNGSMREFRDAVFEDVWGLNITNR